MYRVIFFWRKKCKAFDLQHSWDFQATRWSCWVAKQWWNVQSCRYVWGGSAASTSSWKFLVWYKRNWEMGLKTMTFSVLFAWAIFPWMTRSCFSLITVTFTMKFVWCPGELSSRQISQNGGLNERRKRSPLFINE